MPIKGLTTEATFGQGLPPIARLYKGAEKETRSGKDGKEYQTVGKDLDYFRVEFEPQFEHLRPLWLELYGEQPTEFQGVFLAAGTVDEAFASWKEEWNSAGTLIHRCDGEKQAQWWNESIQTYSRAAIRCASPADPYTGQVTDHKCDCKNVGRLSLILPEFIQAAGVFGTVSVVTHSLFDILTVYRYLADIQRMYGRLNGVPFIFGRAKKEISAPKQVKRNGEYVKDGRIKVTKSLFYLHVEPEFTQQRLLPALADSPALGAPRPIDPSTGEIRVRDVEDAKRRLGAGDPEQRRFGKALPPKATKAADHWTLNPERVASFLSYAKTKLSLDEPQVLDALRRCCAPTLEAVVDFEGSDIQALAGIVAAYCEYDEAKIASFTSQTVNFKEEIGFDVYDAARAILSRLEKEVQP